MILISSCICLCSIHWSQVLSREWRCSWSSADRRCSNYIWVINNFIAYSAAAYIRGLTVFYWYLVIGRIRLSVSTVNRTYELSRITHVTPFRKYGKHSTGPSTYGPWTRTYSKLFSCKPLLMVCSNGAQSNEICTYGRVSRGTIPRVRRYGLLYLRTVEYDHYHQAIATNLKIGWSLLLANIR